MRKKLEKLLRSLKMWSSDHMLIGILLAIMGNIIVMAIIPGYTVIDMLLVTIIGVITTYITHNQETDEAQPIGVIEKIHAGAY